MNRREFLKAAFGAGIISFAARESLRRTPQSNSPGVFTGTSNSNLLADLLSNRDTIPGMIVRSGRLSNQSIPANQVSLLVNVTISPALPNTDDYAAWANQRISNGPTSLPSAASAYISAVNNLQLRLNRAPLVGNITPTGASSPGNSDTAATYPSDTVEDGGPGVGHAHSTDSLGSASHQHGYTNTHTHTISYTAGVGSVSADWWIARNAS